MQVTKSAEALQGQVHAAVEVLRRGGVVAIPTDTLYGLAACALDEAAVRRTFQLKRRPEGLPVPLLIAEIEDVSRWARNVPEIGWLLAGRFWPGALTIVLQRSKTVPAVVCGGKETVGLRVPDHWVPRAIVRQLGAPITGTSANRSGEPGFASARAVRDEFGQEIDMVVEAVEGPRGTPSTVLDLSEGRPRILRHGAVSRREIEEACGLAVAT